MFSHGGHGNWYRRGTWTNNEESERNEAWSGPFIVTEDEKVGVLNNLGEEKIGFNYSVIQKVKNTNVLQAINTDTKIIDFYNKNDIKADGPFTV